MICWDLNPGKVLFEMSADEFVCRCQSKEVDNLKKKIDTLNRKLDDKSGEIFAFQQQIEVTISMMKCKYASSKLLFLCF